MLKKNLSFMLACITMFSAIAVTTPYSKTLQIQKTVSAAKTYTISPNSAVYKGNYKNASAYNSTTKQYFLIRSYLEMLEKKGGGKLILKKGTYKISNVLYIPSNVTIELKDGVTIKKTMKTNSKQMQPTGGIFELLEPSKAAKKGVHGKYNGVHNVKIYSIGKAVIDQAYKGKDGQNCIGLVMCHNKNITIDGITFKNMKYGHFIEMDASNNVVVNNCTFTGYKASKRHTSEAINLDTPDKKTKGFTHDWSKYDCTANKNVKITNCTFSNLEKAIGTHQYSVKKYHTNITISDCTIKNCVSGAIEMMNWKNISLNNIKFINIGKNSKGKYTSFDKSNTTRAILIRGGVSKITVEGCSFKNIPRVIQCMPWKNQNTATKYPIIYNKITKDEYEAIASQNKIISGVDVPYIIVNSRYNDYGYPTKYYF